MTKILYIARHSSGHNDDEGAVTYALGQLGHEVKCLQEDQGHLAERMSRDSDIVLFNKWSDTATLTRIHCPAVFWFWDLVDHPADVSLQRRCEQRKNWMVDTIPLVDIGFLSDGDWVKNCAKFLQLGKLVWLPQGADERFCGFGQAVPKKHDILFIGSSNGGIKRQSFVLEMREKYGSRFAHVSKGCHGIDLRNLIASSKIVVAPDGPVSDNYWSNRIFITLGFGGFLLHPQLSGLWKFYKTGTDFIEYDSRPQLHRLIEYYLERPDYRDSVSANGLKKTLEDNTYRHRCEKMMAVVKERLGL